MYFIILIVLSAIVIIIAEKSSMLRNEIFNDANFCKVAAGMKKPENARPSFSLGRSQLAFWTVIVISSFIYVFLKCSTAQHFDIPNLNDVNLALLGIAAGTTLVSKTIDNSQRDADGDAIPQQDYPSKGFFIDIISDEKGVSIHRLQNVIWTIVVGAIYIGYVANHPQLPDGTIITTQLLALMGISTGAYLGLKINENKNAPTSDDSRSVNANPVAAAPNANQGNGAGPAAGGNPPPAPVAPAPIVNPQGNGPAPEASPSPAPVVPAPNVSPQGNGPVSAPGGNPPLNNP